MRMLRFRSDVGSLSMLLEEVLCVLVEKSRVS